MRNFKRIEPRWKVWSEGRHNLPRQVGHIAAGFCHIWPQVYIQWKVRERMREREYRNRVLLYLNDCEEEERKILACQLYFSMNDFSFILPPPLVAGVYWSWGLRISHWRGSFSLIPCGSLDYCLGSLNVCLTLWGSLNFSLTPCG